MFIALLLAGADTMGSWLLTDQTNNITGKRHMSAITSPADDTYNDKPSLFMDFRSDKKVSMMLFDSASGFGLQDKPVYIKFRGNGQVIPLDAQLWKAGGASLRYAGDDLAPIVLDASRTTVMSIEYLTDKGKRIAEFDTDGIKQAYDYLASHCQFESKYED